MYRFPTTVWAHDSESGASMTDGTDPACTDPACTVIGAGLWRMRDEFPRQLLATHLPYVAPSNSFAHR
jgi:hypothetical protein